jgi:hypothetical protein
MQFVRNKQVDFSRDLPADILSAYLRHMIQVQFDQYYVHHAKRTEATQEDLTAWCHTHCDDIFSITKWAQNCAHFRFYLESDMQRFESYLAESVAITADTAS